MNPILAELSPRFARDGPTRRLVALRREFLSARMPLRRAARSVATGKGSLPRPANAPSLRHRIPLGVPPSLAPPAAMMRFTLAVALSLLPSPQAARSADGRL